MVHDSHISDPGMELCIALLYRLNLEGLQGGTTVKESKE